MNQHTIIKREIECLRGHLNQALDEILQRFGGGPGDVSPVRPPKRETRNQMLSKYDEMIVTGKRATKPEYLKKSKKP